MYVYIYICVHVLMWLFYLLIKLNVITLVRLHFNTVWTLIVELYQAKFYPVYIYWLFYNENFDMRQTVS